MLTYEKLIEIKNSEIKKYKNRYVIKVANSTCAISAGSEKIISLLQKTGIEVIKTGCMSLCYCEPTVEVTFPSGNSLILGDVTEAIALDIVKEIKDNKESQNFSDTFSKNIIKPRKFEKKIALENCGAIDPFNLASTFQYGGYAALYKTLKEYSPQEVIEIIKKSKLRGRGGAGYPTGKKWEIISKNQVTPKYVVCNADEGDPGAFMDRVILESDPHKVLEAMAICGYSIGANHGVIYVRIEYPLAVKTLEFAIEEAKAAGVLGENIFGTGFTFDIELKYGAGAFVCGEETSLIHSMEGKRGEPTSKPPYPAERGYLGCPTNVNNVETFASIGKIILEGADWFNTMGTASSSGTKVFALVGKIAKPSLVEVPIGTTLREIIFEVGGGIKNNKKFKAVQTGGPSGGALSENDLDIPIDYETLTAAGSMMGSGGMIVMDENDCMVNIAKFYLGFTKDESCGKCTPCRIGTSKLYTLLDKVTKGQGEIKDLELIEELGKTIRRASLCGLGKTAPNPVLSSLIKFRDEYMAHIVDKKCPAGVCKFKIKYTINEENCIRCGACMKNCPAKAISGSKVKGYIIDSKICINCDLCFKNCKFNAINKTGL